MKNLTLRFRSIADVRDPSVERTLTEQHHELRRLAEQMCLPRSAIDFLTIDQARSLADGKLVVVRPSGRPIIATRPAVHKMERILAWMERIGRRMRGNKTLRMTRGEVKRVVQRYFRRQCGEPLDGSSYGGGGMEPRAA